MWCPNCKSEYREGFTVCADCGAALVANLREKPAFQPAYLTTTHEENAWELPELLRRMKIACYLAGENQIYIRLEEGQGVPGALFVDAQDLPRAKRCVNLLSQPPLPMEEDELLDAYEDFMENEQEPEELLEPGQTTGNGAWKVFLAMIFILLGGGLLMLLLR